MKTFVPFKQNIRKLALLVSVTAFALLSQAQSTNELNFENVTLYSGSSGADGAVYKFPQVNSNLDALVTIVGRSSSLVSINNIDLPSQGFKKAFQPQIQYDNGSVTGATSWWIEFQVQFVNTNTTNPATLSNFYATGLDIDGNNSQLKEWDTFYGGYSYTTESNTQLSVSNSVGTLNQPSLSGKQFLGTITDHPGIDTSATEIMTTVSFQNTSSIILRLGGTTTASASNANRMYSVWFKNFNFNNPITILPVKLVSFNAVLNNDKADLKWTTASEENVSHFVIEKSFDGKEFHDAGIVFAYGSTSEQKNYDFSDNVNTSQAGVIYYRLRSVDIDGKSQYSQVRIIRIGKQSANNISILTYPNPVTTELRVTIPNNWQNKKVVYQLFNGSGQVSKKTESASSSQTEALNVNSLAPGFYIVRVSCNGETASQKILKQ